MIDLTPLDVRKKRGDFRRILRGYDPEEVDTFMDLVAERFEELVRENLSLGEKTERLGRQVEALEGRENAVQEALVTAQKLRAEVGDQSRRDAEVMQEQANRMAELMKAEAESEIQRRLGEAEGLIRERQRALEDLERSRLKFLKSFRGLLEREMDAVDVEESRRPLEDTPLELEFRGWMTSGEFEEDEPVTEEEQVLEEASVEEVAEEPGEVEEGADQATWDAEDQEEAEEDEPEVAAQEEVEEDEPEVEAHEEVEALEEFEAPVDEPEPGEPEDEGEPQDPWAAAAEFSTDVLEDGEELAEDLPDGFKTQILEGAAPTSLDPGAQTEDQVESGDDPSSIPQEPRWLFSLLKKDEEKGGEV